MLLPGFPQLPSSCSSCIHSCQPPSLPCFSNMVVKMQSNYSWPCFKYSNDCPLLLGEWAKFWQRTARQLCPQPHLHSTSLRPLHTSRTGLPQFPKHSAADHQRAFDASPQPGTLSRLLISSNTELPSASQGNYYFFRQPSSVLLCYVI